MKEYKMSSMALGARKGQGQERGVRAGLAEEEGPAGLMAPLTRPSPACCFLPHTCRPAPPPLAAPRPCSLAWGTRWGLLSLLPQFRFP